jgi:hypothetical protein
LAMDLRERSARTRCFRAIGRQERQASDEHQPRETHMGSMEEGILKLQPKRSCNARRTIKCALRKSK